MTTADERDEARACLRDAMELIREVVMVKDVDIDHDKVWKRWCSAAGYTDKDAPGPETDFPVGAPECTDDYFAFASQNARAQAGKGEG